MNNQDRIENYLEKTKYPRSLFLSEDGRIVGTWIMGNAYVFSGRVDQSAWPGDTVDLNPDMEPTYLDDAQSLEEVPLTDYDIILADPPYSVEDSEHYMPTMVRRNKVMRALSGVKSGTHVVWLDQVLPMYRKDTWSMEGVIGMVKSTNHRFRVITIFKRR